jgi:hypothetical protein
MAKSSTGSQSKPVAKAGSAAPSAAGAPKGNVKGGALSGPVISAWRRLPFMDLSGVPAPVHRAARFMFGGSIGSFVLGTYLVVVTVTERSASLSANNSLTGTKRLTASQFNAEFTGIIIYDIVIALVCAALWAWMARMNQAGRKWARITSTVFFLIWTYYTYQTISGLGTWIILGVLIIELAIWGLGATALYSLWRPDASVFYNEQQRDARR